MLRRTVTLNEISAWKCAPSVLHEFILLHRIQCSQSGKTFFWTTLRLGYFSWLSSVCDYVLGLNVVIMTNIIICTVIFILFIFLSYSVSVTC